MRVAILCALTAAGMLPFASLAPGQTFTVRSASNLQSASLADPFVVSEVVDVMLTGAEPFRQFILAFGPRAAAPIPLPGVAQGALEIQPAGLVVAGIYTTDAMGAFFVQTIIPRGFPFAAPPQDLVVQVLVNQDPLGGGAGGLPWRFTGAQSFAVGEPATTLSVTEVLTTTPGATPLAPGVPGVAPAIVQEGAGTQLIIRGNFLAEATAVPSVRFIPLSPCANPTNIGLATAVAYIIDPVLPGQVSLLVTAPAVLGGGPTAAPLSDAGPLDVEVNYLNTGLFLPGSSHVPPRLSMTGGSIAPIFRSPITPAIAVDGIRPMANLNTGGCPVTINGSNFLDCAEVIFDVAGTPTPGTGVVVVSASVIQVVPPAHAQGLVNVRVRNPDAVESTDAPFAYFDPILAMISVTSITGGGNTPPNIIEGTGGLTVTATVQCPFVGPQSGEYTALDPRSGINAVGDIQLRMGSLLDGTVADVAVTPTSVTVTGPGTVDIVFNAPDVPPGLIDPPALSSGGSTNTGQKSVQVIAPICLNPLASPHATYAAIESGELGNRVNYLAAAAPTFANITPAPCGRVEGNQEFVITGTGFLTNDPVVPSTNAALAARVVLSGGTLAVPTMFDLVSFDSDTQITVRSPDLSGPSAPSAVLYEVQNPDLQGTGTQPFGFAPSLADGVTDTSFTATAGVILDLDTTPGGSPNVYNFTGDLTIPATAIVRASGLAPLIIRCRGNVTIEGAIELAGGVYSIASPSPTSGLTYPAGGAPGGLSVTDDPNQPMFVGPGGFAPLDPTVMPTPMPYPGAGAGGLHAGIGNGGGGGGMAVAGFNGDPASGGAGGQPYGFLSLPIPSVPTMLPPAIANVLEYLLPPGGSGGGAGGLGLVTPPYLSVAPPPNLAPNGAGGNGGGSILIAADGVITVAATGIIDCSGADGGMAGQAPGPSGVLVGGGGGGGSGGGILLQALQGISVGGNLIAVGGAGGGGGGPGGQSGGGGSDGMIRLALSAACPLAPVIGGATMPLADLTTF